MHEAVCSQAMAVAAPAPSAAALFAEIVPPRYNR